MILVFSFLPYPLPFLTHPLAKPLAAQGKGEREVRAKTSHISFLFPFPSFLAWPSATACGWGKEKEGRERVGRVTKG